jgi:hypothetical protein
MRYQTRCLLSIALLLAAFTTFAQPLNDECSGALPLPVNPDLSCMLQTIGSTLDATSSAHDCSGFFDTHDVWYSFVATGPAVRLAIYPTTLISGYYLDIRYEMYSGDCGNLHSLLCNPYSNIGSEPIVGGLDPGATYYLRIYSTGQNFNEFSVCIQTLPTPPVNADCAQAGLLIPSPNADCTTPLAGTTVGISPGSGLPGHCSNEQDIGVLYTFVATEKNHALHISDLQTIYGGMYGQLIVEFFEGTDCGNLTYLACSNTTLYLSDLHPGKTYFIRCISRYNSAHAFNICLTTYLPPANDDCVNAIVIPVSDSMTCTTPIAGTTLGSTTESTAACFSLSGDVWYRFTATQAAHTIQFTSILNYYQYTESSISMELLTGSCGNMQSLRCWLGDFATYIPQTIGDLIAGQTYYLRIPSPGYSALNFNICILTPPPPPVNDACVNATALTPQPGNACAPVAGTTLHATYVPGPSVLCCDAGDVWYSFVASQANHDINLSDITTEIGGFEAANVEVFAQACGDFTILSWSRNTNGNSSIPFTNLTVGSTYFVRVYPVTNKSISFNICIASPPPPPNDECSTALPLPVNEHLTCDSTLTVSLVAATQSRPDCTGKADNDIWYQFKATTNTYRFELTSPAGYNGWGYEIFSGDCDHLTSMHCEQPTKPVILMQDGFTPGATFFLRLFAAPNQLPEITVCTRALPLPPANDDCAKAVTITPVSDLSNCVPTLFTTLGASPSKPGCNGAPSRDVWFSFTATGYTQVMELTKTADYFDGPAYWGAEVYSGDCDQLTRLWCTDYQFPNPAVLYHLSPGQTYLIRVYSDNLQAHDFSLCLKSLPPPPSNDECAQAIDVLPNTGIICDNVYPGTTMGATFDPNGSIPDVWYRFVATSNTHIIELLNPVLVFGYPAQLGLSLFKGSDCDHKEYLGGSDSQYPTLFKTLQIGETYYIEVYPTNDHIAYNFDLCIKSLPPSPPNEDCTGAIELIQNHSLQCDILNPGSTGGAISGEGQSCGFGDDVWYKFTATSSKYEIEALNRTRILGYEPLWMELLQGQDCADFIVLSCNYAGEKVFLKNLTPGETYYIRMSSGKYSAYTYDLCVKAVPPPANDLCTAAISLGTSMSYCNGYTLGSTYGAGPSGISVCSPDNNDVWYNFTATQIAHTIIVNYPVDAVTGQYLHCGMELYRGSCGNLQLIGCWPNLMYDNYIEVGDFIPGDLYYVRIVNKENDINFNICVYAPTPVPDNDACITATMLDVSPDGNCVTSVSGTTKYANPTPESPLDPSKWFFKDVWYAFTAVQNNQIITVDGIGNQSGALTFELYSGTCGALSLLGKQICYGNGHLLQTNLTPGQSYYVRVYQETNEVSTFNICVTGVIIPPNDECTGAIPLFVNPDLTCTKDTTVFNYGATQSMPGCTGKAMNDFWFQFTATSVSHRLDIKSIYNTNGDATVGVEVFEGACGALTPVSTCAEFTAEGGVTADHLVAGNTYFVRVYSLPNNFEYFKICVRTLPDSPANDECAGVVTVQANTGADCDLRYNGTTLAATQSSGSCNGGQTHDVWYQFTATATEHIIDVQTTEVLLGTAADSLGVVLYKGDDCANLIQIDCYRNAHQLLADEHNLEVGASYFIRIFNDRNSAQKFTLCIHSLPPLPDNTDCAHALAVIPSPDLQCTNPVAASTAGLNDNSINGCYEGTGLWYRFIANGEKSFIELQDIALQYGEAYLAIELYAGTCDSLQPLFCTTSPLLYVHELIPGAAYFVRITGKPLSGLRFNLCILTVPDTSTVNCANAIPVTANTGLNCDLIFPGNTLDGVSSQNVDNPSVWFVFTATSNTHVFELLNTKLLAGYDASLQADIYAGDDCNHLELITSFFSYSSEISTLFIPGKAYYVNVYSKSASAIFRFDLCIKTLPLPPANEDCADAIEITPNHGLDCIFTTSGTTSGAINSREAFCGTGNDVWYKFVAISPIHFIELQHVTMAFNYGNLWMEVLEGDDCMSLSYLSCAGDYGALELSGLKPGKTYYVRVTSDYQSYHNFDICIKTVQPPPNDLCINAQPLEVSAEESCSNKVHGTTYAAQATEPAACGYDGVDVWYSFTAAQTAHTISLTDVWETTYQSSYRFGVEVYSGTCGNMQRLNCRGLLLYGSSYTLGDLQPGTVYYIRFISDGYGAEFNICVGTPPTPPVNDNCATATEIPVSPDKTCISPVNGTTSLATPGAGDGELPNDLWYEFTALGGNHIVTADIVNYNSLHVEIYSGVCGALTLVGKMSMDIYFHELLLTNLTPGARYYVRVFGSPGYPSTFGLCVLSVPKPPNDECDGAFPLIVSPDLSCGPYDNIYSNYGSTQSLPGCTGSAVNDVWFQFIATGTSMRVDVGVYGSSGYGMEIYEGTCGALTSITPCKEYDVFATVTLQNLVAGNTYYIRHYSYGTNFHEFKTCLRSLPEPPANDDCAQATLISANPDVKCDVQYNGSTFGARQSSLSCQGKETHDVWYKFTALSPVSLIELNITKRIFDSDSPIGMEIYSGADCSGLTSIRCFETYGVIYEIVDGLTTNETYYIRVFSQYNYAHEFSLCIRTLPPHPTNEDCFSALPVTPSSNLECSDPVGGSTTGLTTVFSSNCYPGSSLWYQFTATGTSHLMELRDIVYQIGNHTVALELYTGDCYNLQLLYCSQGDARIYAPDLTPGMVYYIRVAGDPYSGFGFNLCLLTVPPVANVTCAGAISIPVSPVNHCSNLFHGSTLGAAYNPDAPGCYGSLYTWYSFVATAETHLVTLTNIEPASNTFYYRFIQLFNGDCDQTDNYACNYAFVPTTMSNLTPGKTYYFRVGTKRGDYFNFDACISTPQPDIIAYRVRLYNNSDFCNLTNDETIEVTFQNLGDGLILPDQATLTLVVSGANNGIYGPVNFTGALAPNSGTIEYFTGVDLSNPGENHLIFITSAVNDIRTDNDTLSTVITGLPLITYYQDSDDDGYGNPQAPLLSCVPIPGYITDNTDCDDTNPAVHPNATEICDGLDDNCDGIPDEGNPDLLYAYTVIGINDVYMKTNTVQAGGVGLTGSGKKARLQMNTAVISTASFVKAPVVELQTGSQVTTTYSGQVPAALLPPFQANAAPTTNNITIPNNSAPVTLNLSSYGNIVIGLNTAVTFSGSSSVNIKELTIKDGSTIAFGQNTVLSVNKGMTIAKNTVINPGNAYKVQCFAGENIAIDRGAHIAANMYTLKDLRLEKASAGVPTEMTGLFIATNVYAQDYTNWNWDATNCPFSQNIMAADQREDRAADLETRSGSLRIYPNPASEETQVSFDLEADAVVNIQVSNAAGRLIRSENLTGIKGRNRFVLQTGNLPEGVYTVLLSGQDQRQVGKLVVLRP